MKQARRIFSPPQHCIFAIWWAPEVYLGLVLYWLLARGLFSRGLFSRARLFLVIPEAMKCTRISVYNIR